MDGVGRGVAKPLRARVRARLLVGLLGSLEPCKWGFRACWSEALGSDHGALGPVLGTSSDTLQPECFDGCCNLNALRVGYCKRDVANMESVPVLRQPLGALGLAKMWPRQLPCNLNARRVAAA